MSRTSGAHHREKRFIPCILLLRQRWTRASAGLLGARSLILLRPAFVVLQLRAGDTRATQNDTLADPNLTLHRRHAERMMSGGAPYRGGIVMALEQELETYRRELPRLLGEGSEGKWVAVLGEELLGVFP